ncbi:unnamed protein product [Pedinophyceae sp. YPF-701]|nr:unnamed protein product [Pedinophyceae sp. YPF-701]
MAGPGESKDIVLVTGPDGKELTPEEAEKQQKELKEFEDKLKFITDKVPTKTYMVMGSAAGAGSGTFHIYRKLKRAEEERWARVEREAKEKDALEEFERRKREREEADEARLAKNREKRLKKRKKKGKAGDAKPAGADAPGSPAKAASDDDGADAPPVDDLD